MHNFTVRLIFAKNYVKTILVIKMKSRLAKREFFENSDYGIVTKTSTGIITTHWHDFYEFDLIVRGTGKTVCNGEKYQLKRGVVSLLSPLDFHEYVFDESVDMINIQFQERNVDCDLIDRLSFVKEHVVCFDDTTMENVEKLCELLKSPAEGKLSEEYRKRITECIIISFLNASNNEKNSNITLTSIKKAVVYLNTHFFKNPSMKETADKLFLNPSYFSRAFKKATGVTYKEYLRTLKLEYSRNLIKNTDLPLIDIAAKSGYETQSHFNREFKERYGISPTGMRADARIRP